MRIKPAAGAGAPNIATLNEVLAIYFAGNLPGALRGTPWKVGIHTALRKIERSLPVQALDDAVRARHAPTAAARGWATATMPWRPGTSGRWAASPGVGETGISAMAHLRLGGPWPRAGRGSGVGFDPRGPDRSRTGKPRARVGDISPGMERLRPFR